MKYEDNHLRAVASGRAGGGGFSSSQFLAEQLTLSQPGGQIMPTKVLGTPPPGFSDLATALRYTYYIPR